MNVEPRDYQRDFANAVHKNYKDGVNKQLGVLATGGGKTIVFNMLAKHFNERTLILAHRDELIQQAVDKMEFVWPEVDVGVVKAERNEHDHQVTVASVQTLDSDKRIAELSKDYQFIVTDEAHHSIAPSYQKIYEHLGLNNGSTALHLGVTATPNRSDRKGLIATYDEVVYEKNLVELIVEGYLCDIRSEVIQTEGVTGEAVDEIMEARTTKKVGTKVLAKILELPDIANHIVSEWKRLAGARQTICFNANVEQAYNMAELFQQHGIRAEAVSDRTPIEERREIISKYQDGELQVLTNFNVLTEGFDSPSTSCILVARPTDSNLVYTQMVGRATRLAPNKKDCLILDVACISEERQLIDFANLIGKPIEDKSVLEDIEHRLEVAKEKLPKSIEMFDIRAGKTRTGDPFAASRFAWAHKNGEYKVYVGKMGRVHLKKSGDKNGKYYVLLDNKKLTDTALPLDWAMTYGENYVNKHDRFNFARKDSRWRRQPATEKQQRVINKYITKTKQCEMNGGTLPTTRGECSAILDVISWSWR